MMLLMEPLKIKYVSTWTDYPAMLRYEMIIKEYKIVFPLLYGL